MASFDDEGSISYWSMESTIVSMLLLFQCNFTGNSIFTDMRSI